MGLIDKHSSNAFPSPWFLPPACVLIRRSPPQRLPTRGQSRFGPHMPFLGLPLVFGGRMAILAL